MTEELPFVSEAAEPARFTAEEFSRMVDADVFGDRSVELVHGEIIELSPAYNVHGMMVSKMIVRLAALFGEARISTDVFVQLDGDSVRAFDVVVLSEGVTKEKMLEPSEVFLGVEVAYSSAPRDLGEKMRHYAAAGIRAYLVVEIEPRLVHLLTSPGADCFAEHVKVPFGDSVTLPKGAGTFVID